MAATATAQLSSVDQEVTSKQSVALLRNLMRLNLSQVPPRPTCPVRTHAPPPPHAHDDRPHYAARVR